MSAENTASWPPPLASANLASAHLAVWSDDDDARYALARRLSSRGRHEEERKLAKGQPMVTLWAHTSTGM
eukprot:gene46322-53370_t